MGVTCKLAPVLKDSLFIPIGREQRLEHLCHISHYAHANLLIRSFYQRVLPFHSGSSNYRIQTATGIKQCLKPAKHIFIPLVTDSRIKTTKGFVTPNMPNVRFDFKSRYYIGPINLLLLIIRKHRKLTFFRKTFSFYFIEFNIFKFVKYNYRLEIITTGVIQNIYSNNFVVDTCTFITLDI